MNYTGRKIVGPEKIRRDYSSLLTDESGCEETVPEVIYFPETTEETADAVRECKEAGLPITVSGGKTGLGGGAVVPRSMAGNSGGLISLERLTGPVLVRKEKGKNTWTGIVKAGLRLDQLQEILRKKQNIFFPVDPTEVSATLGGMAATNASGARTLFYGSMREWIVGVTVVLADGAILKLRRGEVFSKDERFTLSVDGKEITIPIEPIAIPGTKHAGGYFLGTDTDAVDLFIGSEGTLGIVTELELRLLRPAGYNGYTVIFLEQQNPASLVTRLVRHGPFNPIALEYMDRNSVELLRRYREELGEASGVPFLPDSTEAILYCEYTFESLEDRKAWIKEFAAALTADNIDIEKTWTGFTSKTLAEMKKFRHALPEFINRIIGERKTVVPGLTKIGTDMAVPLQFLEDVMGMYRSELEEADLEYAMFGHIGNGHLHVNMLPKTEGEMKRGWKLYKEFAHRIVEKGGSIFAEHGVGRIKRELLPIQFTVEDIEKMKAVKKTFDPKGMLNPGVLFP